MIQVIRVTSREGRDSAGSALFHDIRRTLGIDSITAVKTARVYRLEGISADEARAFGERVLCESVNQAMCLNEPMFAADGDVIEVAYKPGVMNPEAASILKAAHDLGFGALVAADSSTEYAFAGSPSVDDLRLVVDRLLVNKTVQRVVTEEPETLAITGTRGAITIIPIRGMDDDALMALSKDKLFLTIEEMRVVQEHFAGLGRDPTDGELETIAQTWSEHCSHKTFAATIVVSGVEKPSLFTRLKDEAWKHDALIVSAFEDNSGVIGFYDGLAVCLKVETHNSPSALEPYGGAATGTGGVIRDILGTGQGAQVVLSMDMFCLAPPNLDTNVWTLPPGCLHPDYLLRHVVRGVRDYGNRMGIPTANGSFHFHPDFRAKPTVIVGAAGIIPILRAKKGQPRPGDAIIAIGGRTGRDGIHGATFSSAAMTDRTASVNANAVQIGHAIEEKRTSDALIACRDQNLIVAVTDCGAGGFSSAIGEIGKDTGIDVRLERAPTKYDGLAPWEIWVSESQERMVLAVAPENVGRVLEICKSRNVEATELGLFTDTHRLVVTYDGETLCDLDMAFMHHGLPPRTLVANWQPPAEDIPSSPDGDLFEDMVRVMGHLNICSKESVVRGYDHGVQGTNALPPYGGVEHDGPNDAVVLQPIPDKPYGLVVAHGLNPILMRQHPYWGACWAIAEAMANYVAVGGNPDECALVDNFIWPSPNEHWLGGLDLAMDAIVDAMQVLGTPFVSGKDSLSSTYLKDGWRIDIPPVLCVTAFGRIPDVGKTVSADFKRIGTRIVLVGELDPSAMGGSAYYDLYGKTGTNIPKIDLVKLRDRLRAVHRLIAEGHVLACHDVSEGGVFAAVTEMCIGGAIGARLGLNLLGNGDPACLLFNEMAGCFILEIDSAVNLDALFGDVPHRLIGFTADEKATSLWTAPPPTSIYLGGVLLDELVAAWKNPLTEVFS